MKSLKKVTNNILMVYTSIVVFSIVMGVIIDSDFLLIMGVIISILGALFISNYHTKHITEILKQNNLWTDEVFENKKLPKDLKQKIEIAKEIFKQEEKQDGFS